MHIRIRINTLLHDSLALILSFSPPEAHTERQQQQQHEQLKHKRKQRSQHTAYVFPEEEPNIKIHSYGRKTLNIYINKYARSRERDILVLLRARYVVSGLVFTRFARSWREREREAIMRCLGSMEWWDREGNCERTRARTRSRESSECVRARTNDRPSAHLLFSLQIHINHQQQNVNEVFSYLIIWFQSRNTQSSITYLPLSF